MRECAPVTTQDAHATTPCIGAESSNSSGVAFNDAGAFDAAPSGPTEAANAVLCDDVLASVHYEPMIADPVGTTRDLLLNELLGQTDAWLSTSKTIHRAAFAEAQALRAERAGEDRVARLLGVTAGIGAGRASLRDLGTLTQLDLDVLLGAVQTRPVETSAFIQEIWGPIAPALAAQLYARAEALGLEAGQSERRALRETLEALAPLGQAMNDAVDAEVHVVQEGELLSTIAAQYTGSVLDWRALHAVNRDNVPNPDRVTVGAALRLPEGWSRRGGAPGLAVEEQPRLGVSKQVQSSEEMEEPGALEQLAIWADGAQADLAEWVHPTRYDELVELQESQAGEATPGIPDWEAPDVESGIKGMSQQIWYDFGANELTFEEVDAAAKVVAEVMGIAEYLGSVAEPSEAVKSDGDASPKRGYWWFNDAGSPTWSGRTGGARYVLCSTKWSYALNSWAAWLSSAPPGQRPGFVRRAGGDTHFSATAAEGYEAVPASAQNLDLRCIPGNGSCFATTASMMAQVNGAADKSDHFKGIVDDETYGPKPRKRAPAPVIDSSTDSEMAREALQYMLFETGEGRPVFTGVSYTSRNCNDDGVTDHWVIVDKQTGPESFTFKEPAASSTAEANSEDNVLSWDESLPGLRAQSERRPYVVSWVRTNPTTWDAWLAHKAKSAER